MSEQTRKRRKTEQEFRIYMDFNATTPLAPSVVDIIQEALVTGWANPSSGHDVSLRARNIIDDARQHLLKMVNGTLASEITFMSGGTEANNHVIWNALHYFDEYNRRTAPTGGETQQTNKLPHIITTTIEHDSISNVLRRLEVEKKASVTYVEVSRDLGYVTSADVLKAVTDDTVLVTVMMANNETGVIQKISEISKDIRLLPRKNLPQIMIHTDAAQAIGKIIVDAQTLNVDFITIVGHKFYGPRIGALWVRTGTPFEPMLLGGGQEGGRRAGTENTPMVAGLGEAARLVNERLAEDNAHLTKLRQHMISEFRKTFQDGFKINCNTQNNLPNTLNVSFVKTKLPGRQILAHCNKLWASVGAACHTWKGQSGSAILMAHHVPYNEAVSAIRISLGRHTTRTDIDIVVDDLKQAIQKLQSGA